MPHIGTSSLPAFAPGRRPLTWAMIQCLASSLPLAALVKACPANTCFRVSAARRSASDPPRLTCLAGRIGPGVSQFHGLHPRKGPFMGRFQKVARSYVAFMQGFTRPGRRNMI